MKTASQPSPAEGQTHYECALASLPALRAFLIAVGDTASLKAHADLQKRAYCTRIWMRQVAQDFGALIKQFKSFEAHGSADLSGPVYFLLVEVGVQNIAHWTRMICDDHSVRGCPSLTSELARARAHLIILESQTKLFSQEFHEYWRLTARPLEPNEV